MKGLLSCEEVAKLKEESEQIRKKIARHRDILSFLSKQQIKICEPFPDQGPYKITGNIPKKTITGIIV